MHSRTSTGAPPTHPAHIEAWSRENYLEPSDLAPHASSLVILKTRGKDYFKTPLMRLSSQAEDYLYHNISERAGARPSPLLITHFHQSIDVRSINEALMQHLTLERPITCFRRSKNLANYLVRTWIPETAKPPVVHMPVILNHRPPMATYNAPCTKRLCACCRLMSKKERISGRDGRTHKIPIGTTCESSSLVYRTKSKDGYIRQPNLQNFENKNGQPQSSQHCQETPHLQTHEKKRPQSLQLPCYRT